MATAVTVYDATSSGERLRSFELELASERVTVRPPRWWRTRRIVSARSGRRDRGAERGGRRGASADLRPGPWARDLSGPSEGAYGSCRSNRLVHHVPPA